MGSAISRAQLGEYREVVKDRLPDEAVTFLYMKFTKAAPDGAMTPALFKKYIDGTGVYKDKRIQQQQHATAAAAAAVGAGGKDKGNDAKNATAVATVEDEDRYQHLFRGYDLDCDGIITFKEYLLYHLAIMYSTEELFYVIFNTYDEDGDGYLSLGDIRSVITAATRYVGDCDVRDREVQRVIEEEARRLMGFLDIRRQGRVEREDMRLITQKYPQVLEKMKNLM